MLFVLFLLYWTIFRLHLLIPQTSLLVVSNFSKVKRACNILALLFPQHRAGKTIDVYIYKDSGETTNSENSGIFTNFFENVDIYGLIWTKPLRTPVFPTIIMTYVQWGVIVGISSSGTKTTWKRPLETTISLKVVVVQLVCLSKLLYYKKLFKASYCE